MRAILEAAGYSVHVYTSPHLVRFHERIVLGGQVISDAKLEALLDEVMDKSRDLNLSFFELTPALGFAAFARNPADILLLETGLGGRLDHTNIVEDKLATVITTLSYDHTHLLGDTVESIAREKAGIMRPHTPCLAGHQIYPAALTALQNYAAELGAPLISEQDWPRLQNSPLPSLTGMHQLYNAALAVAALMTQRRFAIPDTAFRHGLIEAQWPARLQKLDLDFLPQEWELWLDGGHNDSAGLALADQARFWAAGDGKPLHIVTGMMGHKDAASFARHLAPLSASVTAIPIAGHEAACAAPGDLAALWAAAGAGSVSTAATWQDAATACAALGPCGRILLAGSLYLAESVL